MKLPVCQPKCRLPFSPRLFLAVKKSKACSNLRGVFTQSDCSWGMAFETRSCCSIARSQLNLRTDKTLNITDRFRAKFISRDQQSRVVHFFLQVDTASRILVRATTRGSPRGSSASSILLNGTSLGDYILLRIGRPHSSLYLCIV